MPTESLVTTRGKKKSKERVTLVVCSNATGSHKIPCSMIGKAARPACIVGRTWPIPYFYQKNAWMDVSIYNAPGHFEAFERNLVKVVFFFRQNCTSWKQACDIGIIAALKKRYKYLYLSDILSYYSLDVNTKECLKKK
ncbi:tigger transposable element-derived protein 6-like [Hydra vulgaris]|uniref:Tigger transposable element-derived protein 6-like n=1 Tax=Hydra vulgaris TaxID=6087 RepID=A0ABM4BNP2_HYDVU